MSVQLCFFAVSTIYKSFFIQSLHFYAFFSDTKKLLRKKIYTKKVQRKINSNDCTSGPITNVNVIKTIK